MPPNGQHFQIFLSIVVVFKNRSGEMKSVLSKLIESVSPLVSDFEIIVVDNASKDSSHHIYGELTSSAGLSNIQVFAVTNEVDSLTANWIGIERALGDLVVTIDPFTEDIAIVSQLIEKSMAGNDIVFARNTLNTTENFFEKLSFRFLKLITGIRLTDSRPNFQLVTKRIINFLLQHPQPILAYKGLSSTNFFSHLEFTYSYEHSQKLSGSFWENIESGMKLLFATTQAPMRIVTVLSLFGAGINVVYSGYVILIGIFKNDVAPGWVSLSLQQSGMFFLISLVLLVLGEYLLHMVRLSNEGPPYHIGKEYLSAQIIRNSKLNVAVSEIQNRE